MESTGRDEFKCALNNVKSKKHSLVVGNVFDFLLQVREEKRDFANCSKRKSERHLRNERSESKTLSKDCRRICTFSKLIIKSIRFSTSNEKSERIKLRIWERHISSEMSKY